MSDFGRLRLLLVEPSALQAKIIRKACDEIGVGQVDVIGTAHEALEAMAQRRPDVVLSALYLPDGSGTGLVGAMRADPALAGLPFILVSSETRPQALDPIRQSLRKQIKDAVKLSHWFDQVQREVLENIDLFLPREGVQPDDAAEEDRRADLADLLDLCRVNLAVDNGDLRGAPVVVEDNHSSQVPAVRTQQD